MRIAGLLICLVLLMDTFLAYGSCAWILWVKHEMISFEKSKEPEGRTIWDFLIAVPKHEQCVEAQKRSYQLGMERAKKDKASSKTKVEITEVKDTAVTVTYRNDNGSLSSMITETYYCLPETFDPRKP